MTQSEDLRHRLAAVLAADVVGYSRLMSDDETTTIESLGHARSVFRQSIESHHGRVIDMAGDSVLAIFDAASGAVNCAIEIQRALLESSQQVPETSRMQFRIGIHLGDLFEKADGTVYGDGVNVAARIEALAQAGGVAISDLVYGAIADRAQVAFDDAGDHQVKNISRAIRVYHARLSDGQSTQRPGSVLRIAGLRKRAWITATAIVVTAIVAAIVWLPPRHGNITPADPANMVYALPDKPSIAVLPFDNMTKDKTQEYFSDGITEDITTDLSKLSGLFVVARNSAFSYKGKSTQVREIAEQLGVRYVLKGSVRRSDQQVRINAQLIDAITGGHVWADRYDGTTADVFALQDRITAAIVNRLEIVLVESEEQAMANNDTAIPEAYEHYLIAASQMRSASPESMTKAKTALEKAISLDPDYANAWGMLASLYTLSSIRGNLSKIGFSKDIGQELLDEALKRPTIHAYRAQLLWLNKQGRHDEMHAILDRMEKLNPNYWLTRNWRGNLALRDGDTKAALTFYKEAQRLEPANPRISGRIARVHIHESRFPQAIEILKSALSRDPDNHRMLSEYAAVLALSGRVDIARKTARLLVEKRRTAGHKATMSGMFFQNYFEPDMIQRLREGLNLAGIPERVTADDLGVAGAQRITGSQLLNTVRSVRQIGKNPNGQWMADHYPDGTGTLHWLGVAIAKFNWTIEDDSVHIAFQSPSERQPYRCDAYTNPAGSRDSLDELLLICTHDVLPFSVFPIPGNA